MRIGFGHTFTYFYSRLFWSLLLILCATFTQTEDVVTKDEPATIQQNLATNQSIQEKTIVAAEAATATAQQNDNNLVHKDEVNHDGVASDPVVQSSFEEQLSDVPDAFTPPTDFVFSEVASQNAGIPNEISDTGHIVVTLVDSATAELQERAKETSHISESDVIKNTTRDSDDIAVPMDNSTEAATFNNGLEQDPTTLQQDTKPLLDVPKIETKENLTEEIPSFSEWTQKQLEQAEKQREEVNSSTQLHANGKSGNNNKVRSKNYASPDCGAKIAAANPEAISPSSVLSPSRDEYKLNTCTSRIWFIVELCEAIQAKKIDLANFELFSSSPKDFSVSVSDRFPSREWSNVGQFTAQDERDVQSFDLHPHLFGKYIKVELHSHYGSEHFCPISLFRVYGTSEFEVLEKEDQLHPEEDADDDDTLDSEKKPGPPNLFSSATDAVISIVKKAAEVLGTKGNATDNEPLVDAQEVHYSPLISTCTTPSHIVVCDNCSDLLFGQVFEMLSCRSHSLETLLSADIVRRTIYNSSVCAEFGFEFPSKCAGNCSTLVTSYVRAFFAAPYLAALCNTMAIMENKVVLNVSNQVNVSRETIGENISEAVVGSEPDPAIKDHQLSPSVAETTSDLHSDTANEVMKGSTNVEIKPTKTLTAEEEIEMTQFAVRVDETGEVVVQTHTGGEETHAKSQATISDSQIRETADAEEEVNVDPINNTVIDEEPTAESNENLDLEHLISDLDNTNTTPNSATPAPPKESVFLRLSNRIKTLERNMSLSSQYLEELSRRYKKQVEEMQRLLERTITTLNEESKRKDARNDRLEAKLAQLTDVVEALVAERENTFNPLHWLALIIVTTISIFTFCRRSGERRHFATATGGLAEVRRRKSIDVVSHHTPFHKQRRPSEEALKITGTYEHLLLDEGDMRRRGREARERKRKRKKGLQRSNSITTLSEEHHSAWPVNEVHPIGGSGLVDAAPIVLEESDNNPLQDMPLPKPLRPAEDDAAISGPSNGRAALLPPPKRKISSPAFLRAVETRKTQNGFVELLEKGHKKSASVDETTRQGSPTPSAGNASLNLDARKKEKKGLWTHSLNLWQTPM